MLIECQFILGRAFGKGGGGGLAVAIQAKAEWLVSRVRSARGRWLTGASDGVIFNFGALAGGSQIEELGT